MKINNSNFGAEKFLKKINKDIFWTELRKLMSKFSSYFDKKRIIGKVMIGSLYFLQRFFPRKKSFVGKDGSCQSLWT